ncbi:MAG TPA: formylglycine-generating enzyme family protein, partial [Myxococcales bacterium]|nr:formylglycine-generating enzyme family protein [Myxococcales bacterium]
VAPAELTLPPGSYLLTLKVEGSREVRYPLLLERGERRIASVALPVEGGIPPGFVFIPGGPFLFGSGDEDAVRQFFSTVPIHQVETGPYLIAEDETTYAEWIEFLEALPPGERRRHAPHPSTSVILGAVRLLPTNPAASGKHGWILEMQPSGSGAPHRAREDEPITFSGRATRKSQSWLRLPVAGISFDDAQAYARWLDDSGRVPGARLCTEREWERAARGADARSYPHGDRLAPDDANFDRTYGKDPNGFGPDEVGSHPASKSPFGVNDLTGNVWEWTTTSFGPPGAVLRGGGYYYDAGTDHADNRFLAEPTLRDPVVGLRICAPAPMQPSPQPPGSPP